MKAVIKPEYVLFLQRLLLELLFSKKIKNVKDLIEKQRFLNIRKRLDKFCSCILSSLNLLCRDKFLRLINC